jgi:chromosome segregation ATPase
VKKHIFVGALGIAAGLLLGLAYGHMRLAGEQKVHQAKLGEINRRMSQVQRKYGEERTLEESLEDEKQAVANQLDAAKKGKEGLASENRRLKDLADVLHAGTSDLEKKITSLETKAALADAQNGRLSERLAAAEAERVALDRKQRQTFQTLQEREKELRQLAEDSRLRYDRCAEHNTRLYTIAEDVIHKYESRGVVKTLLANEPFTQIKRVELEKLVEEYKDKVDQEKLRSQ